MTTATAIEMSRPPREERVGGEVLRERSAAAARQQVLVDVWQRVVVQLQQAECRVALNPRRLLHTDIVVRAATPSTRSADFFP